VGDAVNVASRLCEAAAPQEILLTAAFANQLTTMTGLVRLPDRPVRGRVQPVAVFSASPLAPAQSGTDDRPEP
jgi:class 3 adenylate cyclase